MENYFFSDTEIDDKEENKNENGKKLEKKENGKFGKKEIQEIQGIQGKKFENEKIIFENEKFEKKVEKMLMKIIFHIKKKNMPEILQLKILKF